MGSAISKYTKNHRSTMHPPQMVALIFKKCSHWVDDIDLHLQEKNYFKRFEMSEKVITTITTLMAVFEKSDGHEKNETESNHFSKEIQGFCILILTFLTEINRREDRALCQQTSLLLQEMSQIWKNVD